MMVTEAPIPDFIDGHWVFRILDDECRRDPANVCGPSRLSPYRNARSHAHQTVLVCSEDHVKHHNTPSLLVRSELAISCGNNRDEPWHLRLEARLSNGLASMIDTRCNSVADSDLGSWEAHPGDRIVPPRSADPREGSKGHHCGTRRKL
jgi:hypothetical protein